MKTLLIAIVIASAVGIALTHGIWMFLLFGLLVIAVVSLNFGAMFDGYGQPTADLGRLKPGRIYATVHIEEYTIGMRKPYYYALIRDLTDSDSVYTFFEMGQRPPPAYFKMSGEDFVEIRDPTTKTAPKPTGDGSGSVTRI